MILMKTSTEPSNGEKTNKFVYEKFQDGELSNNDLVSLIILCFDLLQLKTIASFAKIYNKTYRGVKSFNKNIVNINGIEFVVDND
jgi:hypothetical protein